MNIKVCIIDIGYIEGRMEDVYSKVRIESSR